jgi:hypothetical protein
MGTLRELPVPSRSVAYGVGQRAEGLTSSSLLSMEEAGRKDYFVDRVSALTSVFSGVAATARDAAVWTRPNRLASSANLIWAPGAAEKYAGVSLEPALTAGDRTLLKRLLGPADDAPATSMLQAITDGGWSSETPPDFLAVRSGADVTPEFSGGER